MTEQTPKQWPTLYSVTGDIKDINTLLVSANAAPVVPAHGKPVLEYLAEQRSRPEMAAAMDRCASRIAINMAYRWMTNHGEAVFACGGMAAVDSMNIVIARLRKVRETKPSSSPIAHMHRSSDAPGFYYAYEACDGDAPGAFPVYAAAQLPQQSAHTALAACRDAFPIPPQGSPLEQLWGAAMGEPESIPAHVKACAAQQSAQPEQESVYQYQLANGSWIDQAKDSHDYNVKMGQAVVRVLYTAAQPVQPKEIK